MVSRIALTLTVLASVEAFSVNPTGAAKGATTSSTALHMGLFDGVKDAFSAPALERSVIDSERETPIDRWMGWSVVSENDKKEQSSGMLGFVSLAGTDVDANHLKVVFSTDVSHIMSNVYFYNSCR